ncbi:MAG: hypothetical protein M1835_007951 [Candelina submexicana]|nr:MAG: hypothetical protein M1835_007951 [Candelina submexicana]
MANNQTSGFITRSRVVPLLNTSRIAAVSTSFRSSSSSSFSFSSTSPPSSASSQSQSSPQPSTSTVTATASSSPQPAPTSASPAPAPSSSQEPVTRLITSIITASQSNSQAPAQPTTIVLTSTSPPTATSAAQQPSVSSSEAASSSTTAAALPSSSAGSATAGKGGLSTPAKTAIAVVIPVVAVALIAVALLFLWRRRKQRKEAEELRRKEVEEYGFNPNNDPTLPTVGNASSNSDEREMTEDGTGYRGWGTTPNNARKASTQLSNGNGTGPIGMAISDQDSNPGGYNGSGERSPTHMNSESHSGEPLVNSPHSPSDRPTSGDSETVGALGAGPTSMGNRHDIHRGPSNASSSYSAANRSDNSGEGPLAGGSHGPQYYNNDGAYYEDGAYHQQGPYGDNGYGGGQPVIRDVQARRNTRIEKPSVFPPQGNSGIAQNF